MTSANADTDDVIRLANEMRESSDRAGLTFAIDIMNSLIAIRRELNIPLRVMAERTGWSVSSVNGLENFRNKGTIPSLPSIIRYAAGLCVEVKFELVRHPLDEHLQNATPNMNLGDGRKLRKPYGSVSRARTDDEESSDA